jgi:hypothetical protein
MENSDIYEIVLLQVVYLTLFVSLKECEEFRPMVCIRAVGGVGAVRWDCGGLEVADTTVAK